MVSNVNVFNSVVSIVHKMVKHNLEILRYCLTISGTWTVVIIELTLS